MCSCQYSHLHYKMCVQSFLHSSSHTFNNQYDVIPSEKSPILYYALLSLWPMNCSMKFLTHVWQKVCYCQINLSVVNSINGNRKHVKAKLTRKAMDLSRCWMHNAIMCMEFTEVCIWPHFSTQNIKNYDPKYPVYEVEISYLQPSTETQSDWSYEM